MRNLTRILFTLLAATALGACETIEGAGEDIEDAGDEISDAANDAG